MYNFIKSNSFQESALNWRVDGFWIDALFLFFNLMWLKKKLSLSAKTFFYLKKSASIIRKTTKTYKIMTACHSALKKTIISVFQIQASKENSMEARIGPKVEKRRILNSFWFNLFQKWSKFFSTKKGLFANVRSISFLEGKKTKKKH